MHTCLHDLRDESEHGVAEYYVAHWTLLCVSKSLYQQRKGLVESDY